MQQLIAKPSLLIFVIIYVIMLVVVGAYYSRKAKTSDEFVRAGGGLGSIVLMGTFLATFTGNGTISGGGNSLAFTYGLWPGIFFAVPSLAGVVVLFLLAGKIRQSESFTVAGLLENKYGHAARTVSGVIIALSMISICAYQYRGLAYVLNVTTGMDVNIATALSAVLIIFLAMSGGLKSVAVTDALSAFIMLIGIIVATPLVIKSAGGWDNVISTAAATNPDSLTFSGGQTVAGFLSGYLPLFFLSIGDQNLYQRIAAGDGDKTVKKGFIGWFVGLVVVVPLVAVIAFSAKTIFGDNIDAAMAFMSTTTVIPTFAGGLLLAAATAFIITTGDSYLLSGATNITYDIYADRINPNASDHQKFVFTRGTILVTGVLAYILLQFFPTVLAIQYWSYTIYGAGISPALIGALCWKKVTKMGGIASMVVGTVVTIAYEAMGQPLGIATVLIAVPVATVVLIVVSLATQGRK
ncbi:MAG: sodium:solute symporter family protein [Dorea sp.]|jgi:SSS family solute:Na+ symporter|nr:sodium:solute symporter family protein [Dorea sp.]